VDALLGRFVSDQSDDMAVKYGLIVALIAIAVITAFATLPGLGTTFETSVLS
jgi:Flp pilus assembly pilin Flp